MYYSKIFGGLRSKIDPNRPPSLSFCIRSGYVQGMTEVWRRQQVTINEVRSPAYESSISVEELGVRKIVDFWLF